MEVEEGGSTENHLISAKCTRRKWKCQTTKMAITKSPSSAYRFGQQQLCFCGAKPSFGYGQGIHNVTSKFCMQIPSKYRPGQSQLYRFHYANDTRAKRCRPGALHFGLPDRQWPSSDRHVNVFRTSHNAGQPPSNVIMQPQMWTAEQLHWNAVRSTHRIFAFIS